MLERRSTWERRRFAKPSMCGTKRIVGSTPAAWPAATLDNLSPISKHDAKSRSNSPPYLAKQ